MKPTANLTLLSDVARLPSRDLLAAAKELAAHERGATVALIVHLAEIDRRRLYLGEGFSSLFTYCTRVLHLSEHAAYRRIEAARLARRLPVTLEHLAAGAVTLTTVGLLAPQLTPENHQELLDRARYRSRRQVEELVAQVRPQPPVPATVRRLPSPTLAANGNGTGPGLERSGEPAGIPLLAGAPQAAAPDPLGPSPPVSMPPVGPPPPAPRAIVEPLASERYRVQFTATAETCRKLRLAQDLLRHQIPSGALDQVVDRALTVLLHDLARRKFAATDRPRTSSAVASGSRYIPAHVKRAVWLRDGGRCAFVAPGGRRCAERAFLEFHHVVPYGVGGEPIPGNIELRCRAHNQYEAMLHCGAGAAPVAANGGAGG